MTAGYTLTCSNYNNSLALGIGKTTDSFCRDEGRNKVALAVGKDDRLWIRVGEQWKRVVVEG